uniref:EGF-like domain-containing protein n=2 Tax=Biomphalaria TaxID=6525 RepID=A0A2C9LWX4_BIOGL
MPEFIPVLEMPTAMNTSMWFKKDVNDDLLYRFLETELNIDLDSNIPYSMFYIILYRNIQHAQVLNIDVCAVANQLRRSSRICTTGNVCIQQINGTFSCYDDTECGNWNWGTNCSTPCDCYRNGTQRCGKTYGTCICKPGFHTTVNCDKDIDECQACWVGTRCVNFEGGYECVPCDWRYGIDCSHKCLCNQTNTEQCNGDGSCRCKTNFRGTYCDEIIDFCYQQCQGDHEFCMAKESGFECGCYTGYIFNSSAEPRYCQACPNWTWNTDCTSPCECNINTTLECNTVTGTCLCQPGFQDTQCDMDIDECAVPHACADNSECVNTYGSYKCLSPEVYMKVSILQTIPEEKIQLLLHGLKGRVQEVSDYYSYSSIDNTLKLTFSLHRAKYDMTGTDVIVIMSLAQSGVIKSDMLVMDFLDSFQASKRVTSNEVAFEIESIKVYKSLTDADLDVYPIIYKMCQNYGKCSSITKCLNTEFLPICQEICDYGMYADKKDCQICSDGKTTLVRGADSQYYCIERCNPGYNFALDKLTCELCPQEMYWSDADNACHVCPYISFNSTSCSNGEWRTVNNPFINIEMNVTIVTPKCLKDDPQYFNSIDERELVRLMITQSNPYSNRFCSPYYGCENILTNYVGNAVCIPDPSCTVNTTCKLFHTIIQIGIYHTR